MIKKNIKRYSDPEFARRLRTLMGNRDLKLRDLARATGNALSTVSTWKRGRIPRGAESVSRLARALSVTSRYLLSGDTSEIFSNERSGAAIECDSPRLAEINEYVKSLVAAAAKSERGLEFLLFELRTKIPLEKYSAESALFK